MFLTEKTELREQMFFIQPDEQDSAEYSTRLLQTIIFFAFISFIFVILLSFAPHPLL